MIRVWEEGHWSTYVKCVTQYLDRRLVAKAAGVMYNASLSVKRNYSRQEGRAIID